MNIFIDKSPQATLTTRVSFPVKLLSPFTGGFFLENSFSPKRPWSAKDCFRCEAIKGVFFSLSSSFKSIKLRIFKGKEKPVFPEFHSTQDRGTYYCRHGYPIPNLVKDAPTSRVEISKNFIGSRAENHLIFKGALNGDCKSPCAPLPGASAKRG